MTDLVDIWNRAFDPTNDLIKTSATFTGSITVGDAVIKDHDSTTKLDVVSFGQALASPTSIPVSGHDGTNTRVLRTDATGALQFTSAFPATVIDGTKTVALAATPEALPSHLNATVILRPLSTNTLPVFIGNATSQNMELGAGDVLELKIDNTAKVFVRVQVNGEGVAFGGVKQ